MKLLYISPYKLGNEYTVSAINYIIALDKIGVDIVPRFINENRRVILPSRISELEKKDITGCNRLVIHAPPLNMEYHNKNIEKCIGITAIETNDINRTVWGNRLNLMDSLIVSNNLAKKTCETGGVTKPISVIPYATDLSKYKVKEKSENILDMTAGMFTFYYIGREQGRKNLKDIIRAFHLEFGPFEPVQLLIKSGGLDLPPEISKNTVFKMCKMIKEELRLYSKSDYYKQEIIITNYLQEEELYKLHCSCDCLINVSGNENFCMPIIDAMGFEKPVISTKYAGPADYLNDENCYLVDSYNESCFGYRGSTEVYSGYEEWSKPNIASLRKQMRLAFERKDSANKIKKGLETISAFDYKLIAPTLLGIINEQKTKKVERTRSQE